MTIHSEEQQTLLNCEVHGQYSGKKSTTFGFTHTESCPTCLIIEAVQKAETKAQEEKNNQLRKIAKLKRDADIPHRFKECTFDNYIATTENQITALKICKQTASSIQEGKLASLVLLGSVGTGKTHLAIAIANASMECEYSATYTTVRELIRSVRATWSKNSSYSESEVISRYIDCDILILDEVGVQASSENERNILFDIFDARYGSCLPTVVISNLDMPNLTEALGDRIIDRLRDDGKVVTCNWPSSRGKKAQQHRQPIPEVS